MTLHVDNITIYLDAYWQEEGHRTVEKFVYGPLTQGDPFLRDVLKKFAESSEGALMKARSERGFD